MSLRPNVYDEGLVLTAAMRVGAWQIPHRDFYANYGPAQFYLLAGLFKLFGTSILVERLLDLFIKALVVAVVYGVASLYCRRAIAIGASVLTILWLFGVFDGTFGTAMIPVSLINLIATTLLLPLFHRPVSATRMVVAGAVAGAATLFRYDTGAALLFIQTCTIIVAVYFRFRLDSNATPILGPTLRVLVSTMGPYLSGFVIIVLPPVLYYLLVAPLHPFVHDMILYPSQYYHRGRNLPFPGITLKHLDNLIIYGVIVLIGLALSVATVRLLRMRPNSEHRFRFPTKEADRYGCSIAFGLLAMGMYFKGLVRTTPIHLALAIIPSAVLLAVFIEQRPTFPRVVRVAVMGLVVLFFSSAVWSVLREAKNLRAQHSSLLENLWMSARPAAQQLQTEDWCRTKNPLTKGICFLPDYDRIRTIEFITNHVNADQKLFVGLTRHDTIYENDNLIYFATQRLPVTHWSHFDPGLQNRLDIQEEMIRELSLTVPEYIVRDSEFDSVHEPNDSAKSSGVMLFDDYLRLNYQPIQDFGIMSVWQRRNPLGKEQRSADARTNGDSI